MTPALLVLALVVLAGAWVLLALRWRTAREPDGWLEATAADGHPVVLARFRAQGPRRAAEPVVLCHGLGANRFNLDLDDDVSLARHLARRGFEVYVLELRGRGRSVRAGLRGLVPTHGFDCYVRHDLPAALDAVRARHGAERVHWVGHSMGGLVLYALLARDPDAPVRSAVTVGSPVCMRLPWVLRLGLRVLAALRLPLCWGRVAFLAAPVTGWVAHPPIGLLVNPRNVRPARLRAACANLVADLSAGEVDHFARMARDRFGSRDGACDYAAGLAGARTPVLVVAGSADRLAPPDAVRAGFERLGGEAGGHRYRVHDGYGHGDLVIGDAAPAVVFPEVAAWLEAHDPAFAGVHAAAALVA